MFICRSQQRDRRVPATAIHVDNNCITVDLTHSDTSSSVTLASTHATHLLSLHLSVPLNCDSMIQLVCVTGGRGFGTCCLFVISRKPHVQTSPAFSYRPGLKSAICRPIRLLCVRELNVCSVRSECSSQR